MLLLGSSFAKIPVLSLRIGARVGTVVGHVINPHNLKIDALWVKIGGFKEPGLLLIQDIRETSPQGVVIDDMDVITPPEDMHRLKAIIELRFELLDKRVISGHSNIGKVQDYAVDRDSYTIQKLYVSPFAWKKLQSSRLTIDRSLVIEVSQSYVKVRGPEIKNRAKTLARKISQSSLSPATSASASLTEE